MKKFLLVMMLVGLFTQLAPAQKKADAEKRENLLKDFLEMKKEQQNPINSLLSAADVGDPESFGKNAKFLGTAASGVVYVYYSCDPAVLLADLDLTLGANDRCLAHTPGGPVSSATFTDLGKISIPGKSADNVIYFILNNTLSSEFQNTFANGLPIQLTYSPRITIESVALNDPAAVDPTTGLPLNGVLTVPGFGTKFFNRILPAGESDLSLDSYSSAATRGFARTYFADLGLPQSVINQLYSKPMTIKLGMRVSVRGVFLGQYLYSARFLGN
jgi:hypothetical protein